MVIPPAIQRMTLIGGVGDGVVKVEATIQYAVNNQEAVLVIQCVIQTGDDPTLEMIKGRVFQAVQQCQPAKSPEP